MKSEIASSKRFVRFNVKLLAIFSVLAAAAVAAVPAFSTQAIYREPIQTKTPNLDIMKIGHRGVRFQAPENTIPSFQKAIELKYDYCEIDLQYSRDGVPVVFHDPFLSGKTDGFGAISLFKLEKLKKLDAGSHFSPEFKGTRIPTLEEVLQTIHGKINLYLDQKAPPQPVLYDLLKKYGFSRENMVVVAQIPGFMTKFAMNFENAPVMPNLRHARDIDDVLAKFPTAKAFNVQCRYLTSEMIAGARERGVMVFANVLGVEPEKEEEWYRRVIELGADAIQFDKPEKLFPLLDKMRSE